MHYNLTQCWKSIVIMHAGIAKFDRINVYVKKKHF